MKTAKSQLSTNIHYSLHSRPPEVINNLMHRKLTETYEIKEFVGRELRSAIMVILPLSSLYISCTLLMQLNDCIR